MLLTKPKRPRSLSMHERGDIIIHPENFVSSQIDYQHDKLASTLLSFVKDLDQGANLVKHLINKWSLTWEQ